MLSAKQLVLQQEAAALAVKETMGRQVRERRAHNFIEHRVHGHRNTQLPAFPVSQHYQQLELGTVVLLLTLVQACQLDQADAAQPLHLLDPISGVLRANG